MSTSLIADHCAPRLRRLGLGGLSSLTDLDLEDVGRCHSLTWLDLCACSKLSDTGLKSIGRLAERQMKARAKWQSTAAAATAEAPPVLVHLDLGGLGRLSDEGLHKLTVRMPHLHKLDLRGCGRLTEDGLARALAGYTVAGVQVAPSLTMPELQSLTVSSLPAASEAVISLIQQSRPRLTIVH